ncbi:membrane protein insertion efficiency factor YidD [Candidatus Woesebacteria bacterium]|nr:membrane protein insertion efficiency factor YidD [Candidatus Woesebacteria bacterium]
MKSFVLAFLRFYKYTSFFHNHIFKTLTMSNSVCIYTPTCSEYMYQAVEKYGAFKGMYLGIKRLISCNPWSHGGHDPVK